MDCEFHLQDPTSPDTVYLFEAIIASAREAASCTGLFAFASRGGVESLIGDPEIQSFLGRSTMALVVGIDAVTSRGALERLLEFELQYERLSVRVFRNPTGALFHPKVARFDYHDGSRSIIVGSGNLTPGGLRQNFEAFSVISAASGETLDLSSWDRFLANYAADIRAIDGEALERAAQNVVGNGRLRRDVEPALGVRPAVEPVVPDIELPIDSTDRFLVARVPGAGGRWQQIHFNKEVIEQFFRVRPGTTQRVYLSECRQDGTFTEAVARACVYSAANRNLKIEITSHHGVPYPDTSPPIVMYREQQARSFLYMLLMPGDPGYVAMVQLTEDLENIGRGLPRVITDAATVGDVWPECPLVAATAARPDTNA